MHAAAAVSLPAAEDEVQQGEEEVADGAADTAGGRWAAKTRHLTRRCGCLR